MGRARLVTVALASALLAACGATALGPSAPLAREQVPAAPAFDASSARQTVVDFLHAYADSATGVEPLAGLVAGAELTTWVRWLGVQHREFEGTIEADADIRDVEFVGAVDAERVRGAQVGLSATVTFTFSPIGDDPIERARILDGPVTLVQTAGTYRVLDLFRDGMQMSDGIRSFRGESRTVAGVTVTLDSLFMFAPNWQFNVEITNPSDTPLEAVEDETGLFVDTDGAVERESGALTPSVRTVPAGARTDGILVAPIQDVANGRTLVLTYRAGRHVLRFPFPLTGLVEDVPPAATEPPATGTTGASGAGATGATA